MTNLPISGKVEKHMNHDLQQHEGSTCLRRVSVTKHILNFFQIVTKGSAVKYFLYPYSIKIGIYRLQQFFFVGFCYSYHKCLCVDDTTIVHNAGPIRDNLTVFNAILFV